jgi:NAD(P)H-hydrate epimerase
MQIVFVKLFSVNQIRAWDKYTIESGSITSAQLMERAAMACSKWISSHYPADTSFMIICGKGNNGGDGLAISRMLKEKFSDVSTYVIEDGPPTSDFDVNFDRLIKVSEIYAILEKEDLPAIANCVVIDAIFGTGLSKKPATPCK